MKNDFFGHTVNCTGLLVGQDIIKAVEKTDKKYDYLVMPNNVLKEGTDLFLDGLTLKDVIKATKTEIKITDGSGKSFVSVLQGEI